MTNRINTSTRAATVAGPGRGAIKRPLAQAVLDLPYDVHPDPDDYIRAAMDWHFSPETGSPFWLKRAKSLDFDPRIDVRSFDDLTLFPNVANELRTASAEDLLPKGYEPRPGVVGLFESGGTTGVPKKVVLLREWFDHQVGWLAADLDAHGVPGPVNWLAMAPTGPHMIGEFVRATAAARGGVTFHIDLDPRWVKKLIAGRKAEELESYADHLVDQAALVLRSQDIKVLMCTPPLLERLARRDDLVELIREQVQAIVWGGAHMDADTRYLFRTDVFPGVKLHGMYGSTMILGATCERLGLTDDDPCIFDPFSPYITFSVIDPDTSRPVAYGERGQVVMQHVSRSFLLPNNLERDLATRIKPSPGQVGDAVADVTPVEQFDSEAVIEGVY